MFKNNFQKGAIEISTIAAIVIVATFAAAVSIYVTGKYYEDLIDTAPNFVFTPRITLTPTPDITADWYIKTNDAFGFEIKYPQNEQFKEEFGTTTTHGFFKIIDPEKSDQYDISITIKQENGYRNIEDIRNNPDNLMFVGDVTFIGKTKIANEDALEYRTLFGGDNGDNWSENFIFYHNNKVYNIGYGIDAKTKKAINSYAPNILSTFKFTETDAIADWKTYRNDALGFEIKYPADLQYEFKNNEVKIFSAPVSCSADGISEKIIDSEIKIAIKQYSGVTFSQTWKNVFKFDFDTNSYDEIKKIGGKTAYYFYESAEMPFSLTNYLIEQTPTRILKIQVNSPGNAYDCNPPLTNEVSKIPDQILSTFKFIK